LRASELERARNRTRQQALKDKVVELEGLTKQLQEENNRLARLGERTESLKGAVARKDQIIASLKGHIEKLQIQIDELRGSDLQHQTEAEKKIKYAFKVLFFPFTLNLVL
jgi:predicted nuclease with TOPRIM domain